MLKKIFLVIIFSLIQIVFFDYLVSAQSIQDFAISLQNEYIFDQNGSCKVSETFTIENLMTEKYLPSFEYHIKNTNIKNIEVFAGGDKYDPQIENTDTYTKIKIGFNDKVLGKGKERVFTINYDVDNLAIKTGDVWELSIPKIEEANLYKNIKSILVIPKIYGIEAYISPDYKQKKENDTSIIYHFEKEELKPSRIVAGFGNYQTFTYIINYRLKNEDSFKKTESISIPPDTSYQRIFIDSIKPEPDAVFKDIDDNWIAEYSLEAKQTIDVSINGKAQIFSSPRAYLVPKTQSLYKNIEPTKYWNTSDEKIVEVAKSLEDPQAVYDFVIKNLDYDFNLKASERLGAVNTLSSKHKVSCREYSDLMITLLRAKGIPAREVIGYAHTDNETIKPTAFFNDILHSWVEYWDTENDYWVSTDPTWGDTSSTDYFNQFDLRHFAFTIHGSSDELPLPPGSYSKDVGEKDIFINTSSLSNYKETKLDFKNINNILFIFNRKYSIMMENKNHTALYDKNIKYYGDNKLLSEDNFEAILPYSINKKVVKIKYSFFGKNSPDSIMVFINGGDMYLNGPKNLDVYSHTILIFVIVIAIFMIVLTKLHLLKHKPV